MSYEVPAMYVKDYTIGEMFDNELYLLIPFYIFKYESMLEDYNDNETKLKELIHAYENILQKLEDLTKSQKLDEFSYTTIKYMSNKVVQNLARHSDNVKKGIGGIMGGQVLDFEALRILKQGRDEGKAEGRDEEKIERYSL